MKKIKIAFFADMLVRDLDGCMRTIFHMLDRKPENVEIRCFSGSESHIPSADSVTIPDLTIPFNRTYKMALPFFKSQELRRELMAFDPDVIHVSNPSALGRFATSFAKKRSIPVSTIYHTHFISYVDYYLRHYQALIPIVRKTIESSLKSFYNGCNLVLVPTEIMKSELASIGVVEDKMKIWQRGIDKSIFNPSKKNHEVTLALTGNDKPCVLFASRLVWEKNLQTLIEINCLNNEQGRPYNLIVAGDGVARIVLEKQMKSAFFTGSLPQSELASLYATAKVFLFPSISETYGNVVAEAMSCGTPCVIGNGGGTTAFIENYETGFRIEPNDAPAYQNAILDIITNSRLYNHLSESCIRNTRHLDWNELAFSYYDDLTALCHTNKLIPNSFLAA